MVERASSSFKDARDIGLIMICSCPDTKRGVFKPCPKTCNKYKNNHIYCSKCNRSGHNDPHHELIGQYSKDFLTDKA